jgi:hypothetical protein
MLSWNIVKEMQTYEYQGCWCITTMSNVGFIERKI